MFHGRSDLVRRVTAATVAAAATVAVVLAVVTVMEVVDSLSTEGVTPEFVGEDFAMFYTAAELSREGRWDSVYSPEQFADAMDAELGRVSFAYPPPFAQILQPVTALDYQTALALVLSFSILVFLVVAPVSLRGRAVVLLAFAFPIYIAIQLGQFAPIAVVALLGAAEALRRGNDVLAGVLIGLLVLKPQLMVGPLVVLGAHQRTRRAALATVGTATAVIATSLATVPEAWDAYVEGVLASVAPGVGSAWDFSLLGVLAPLDITVSGVIYVLAVTVVVLAGIRLASGYTDPIHVLAVGVTVTVLVSPRMVVYDWALLALVGAWLHPRLRTHDWLDGWIALLVLATMSGWLVQTLELPFAIGWLPLAACFAVFVYQETHSEARVSPAPT